MVSKTDMRTHSLLAVGMIGLFLFTSLKLSKTAAVTVAPTPEGMVLVPAGPFLMGHDADEGLVSKGDATPSHQVTLAAFYIDKTEVTNEAYKQYCDATGYPVPPYWQGGTYPAGEAKFPVRFVNWWEAQAYAQWQGKRLPTEAEWEKAARGTDGRTYPWGNEWNSNLLVWGVPGPAEVGSHPDGASPYGVLDMAGNVWEWTSSWYQAYPGTSSTQTEFGTLYKVVRGGSFGGWPDREFDCATYHRTITRPQSRSEWVGFRCAKSVDTK